MLTNLKIEAPDDEVFPANTPIEVYLEMNADKVLSVRASCLGKECMVASENPFANTYQTDEEKRIMQAERIIILIPMPAVLSEKQAGI